MVSSNNPIISGNVVSKSAADGISITYSENAIISGNRVNNSEYGIRISGCNGCELNGNIINNCSVNGISLWSCDYAIILDNDINNTNMGGIKIYHNNYNIISGNRVINDLLGGGFRILTSHNNTITNNNISTDYIYSDLSGIFLSSSDNNSIQNNIIQNTKYGIYLSISNYNTVTNNTLINNYQAIIEEYCNDNYIENNIIQKPRSKQDFTFLIIVLLIVVVTVIGLLGVLFWRKYSSKKDEESEIPIASESSEYEGELDLEISPQDLPPEEPEIIQQSIEEQSTHIPETSIPETSMSPEDFIEEEQPQVLEEKQKIVVFFSYAIKDSQLYKIKEIAEAVALYEDIEQVLYFEDDTKDNFVQYMNTYVGECDVMVLFCSPNALQSRFVEDEWMAAHAMGKPIIPVYIKTEHIPPILRARIGVEYDAFDMQKNHELLHNLILKKTSE